MILTFERSNFEKNPFGNSSLKSTINSSRSLVVCFSIDRSDVRYELLYFCFIESSNPKSADTGSNDVLFSELDDRYWKCLRLDQVNDGSKTRRFFEVGLRHVTIDNDLAVLADTGQEHLDFCRYRILSLIEDDDAVFESTTAHHLERDDLNILSLHSNIKGAISHPVFNGFDQRYDPRGDLLFKSPWEKPE